MVHERGKFNRWDAFAIFFLTLAPLIYFLPIALIQKTFNGMDFSSFHIPIHYELEQALAQGRLPLWTPNIDAGLPLIAEGHIAIFYLPNLIVHELLPLMPALAYAILFHVIWAAVGMYLLARALSLRVASAFIAAFVFGFNGFSLAHLQHLNLSAAGAWLPWVILLQIQYWQTCPTNKRARGIYFLLISLVFALQLFTGYAQIVALTLIAFGWTGVFAPVLWQPPGFAARRQTLGALVAAMLRATAITLLQIIAGVGIAAVQWLPTLELFGQAVREQIADASFATSYSLDPMAWTQFISPFAWLGTPTIANQEYWAYVGIAPFLLALLVLLMRRDALTCLLALLAGGALLLSLGSAIPLYDVILRLPLYNQFRVPARFLFLCVFGVALLAGIGLDELTKRLEVSRVWHLPAAGTLVVFAGMASVVLGEWQTLDFWMDAWGYLPWLILGLAAGLFWLAHRRMIGRLACQAALLGLTIVDLVCFSHPLEMTLNEMVAPSTVTDAPAAITVTDSGSPLDRLFTNIYNETLRPNHTILYAKQSAQIYSPLALQRNEDYRAVLNAAMLNLMNVRYYFLPSGPLPEGFEEPTASVVLDVVHRQVEIPATWTTQVEIISYASEASGLPEDMLAGELTLGAEDGTTQVLPIRIGIETADWADAGLEASQVNHRIPRNGIPFSAYLLSRQRSFTGLKYAARYVLPTALNVTTIQAQSNLPNGNLTIESIRLISPDGNSNSVASLTHRNNFSVIFKSHAVTVLENQDVLPRAFIVHRAEIVPDDQILERLRAPGFQPGQHVLLSAGQDWSADSGDGKDAVTITEYASERVALTTQTQSAGYLVLTDSWYPGWEAKIDGVRVPIYRADYIFRAIALPPGAHRIEFEFHPVSIIWGAAISLLSLVVVCAPWLAGLRGTSRQKPGAY